MGLFQFSKKLLQFLSTSKGFVKSKGIIYTFSGFLHLFFIAVNFLTVYKQNKMVTSFKFLEDKINIASRLE